MPGKSPQDLLHEMKNQERKQALLPSPRSPENSQHLAEVRGTDLYKTHFNSALERFRANPQAVPTALLGQDHWKALPGLQQEDAAVHDAAEGSRKAVPQSLRNDSNRADSIRRLAEREAMEAVRNENNAQQKRARTEQAYRGGGQSPAKD